MSSYKVILLPNNSYRSSGKPQKHLPKTARFEGRATLRKIRYPQNWGYPINNPKTKFALRIFRTDEYYKNDNYMRITTFCFLFPKPPR